MPCVEEQPEAAYGPFHALVTVKVGGALLDGHVGEVDEGVADVLTLHAEPAVGEAGKAAPVCDMALGQEEVVTVAHHCMVKEWTECMREG